MTICGIGSFLRYTQKTHKCVKSPQLLVSWIIQRFLFVPSSGYHSCEGRKIGGEIPLLFTILSSTEFFCSVSLLSTSVESIIALCCFFFQQSIGFLTSTRRSSWVLLMVFVSTLDVSKIPLLVLSNKIESLARHSFRKKRKPLRACCHWIWVLVTKHVLLLLSI